MATTNKPVLKSPTYDVLKNIALIYLPALGTLYFAIAQIWGLPNAEEVVGTITAVDVFLGIVLGISSKNYKDTEPETDGALVIDTTNPNKDTYSFEVGTPLDEVANKDTITLKVRNDSVGE